MFHPLSWMWNPKAAELVWKSMLPPAVRFPDSRLPSDQPISIKARASDKGMSVALDQDAQRITLSGTTQGDESIDTGYGLGGDYARSVSVSLDVDKAPTQDVFGDETFALKNSRHYLVYTSEGWTTAETARRLADKINDGGEFRAQVQRLPDGDAAITFSRR